MEKLSFKDLRIFRTSGELQVNTYLFSLHGINYVVDPGKGIGEYVDRIKCDVIITHGHYDHIAGIRELEVDRLYISPEDSAFLREARLNLSGFFNDIVSMDISWYNIDDYFDTLLAPGHTPGSRIVVFEGVLFTGDVVFSDTVGRADLNPIPGQQRVMSKTVRTLSKIFKQFPQDWYVCPGHGDIVTLEKLFKMNPFFK
ncbi:MAG TPA: MBL fold metallo-hydrolase [Fervidobacterium sp.]|nr:MBL fold metallo-hydrolase [Fervidobacterium sp.]HPT54220.1 MBL fold metallo-hydrolase [Fervidobacterium sp.]HPZ17744.1 MBL fold metallo-hydrolase [Fervidobacterium sp.]HQE48822.1 MBL fold metallo-hydrolase [Fervidobacterium sp.]HUM42685.1 MBL fold metallo-hydrolase [Fervidobacterium sp.]